jgi:hypothetical protein
MRSWIHLPVPGPRSDRLSYPPLPDPATPKPGDASSLHRQAPPARPRLAPPVSWPAFEVQALSGVTGGQHVVADLEDRVVQLIQGSGKAFAGHSRAGQCAQAGGGDEAALV